MRKNILLKEILKQAFPSEPDVEQIVSSTGEKYKIARVNGKILYIAPIEISLTDEDNHFVESIKREFLRTFSIVKGVNGGSKLFSFGDGDKRKIQVLKCQNSTNGVLLYIDNTKIYNPNTPTGYFDNYATVMGLLEKFSGRLYKLVNDTHFEEKTD